MRFEGEPLRPLAGPCPGPCRASPGHELAHSLMLDTLEPLSSEAPPATVLEPSDTYAGPWGSDRLQRCSSSPGGANLPQKAPGLPERAVTRPRHALRSRHRPELCNLALS